ncbi:Zinc knuckle [Popillia japonica]|uniref:Zinc knuckle n=1 Tax=Popillia japonica TaxID=7064 RepID=A0AAW1IXI1_POPJA
MPGRNVLLKLGRVKIGWVGCRIRERVEVTRCFKLGCRIRERVEVTRCFKCLEFGHRRKDCKGQDRSDLCLNCNQTGHTAKDCASENFCPVCQKTGHRADSTKCLKFRELLRAQISANIKVLQTNLGRGRAAHDILYTLACEKDIDIAIISEPNINISLAHKFIMDKKRNVAIYIRNKNSPQVHHG